MLLLHTEEWNVEGFCCFLVFDCSKMWDGCVMSGKLRTFGASKRCANASHTSQRVKCHTRLRNVLGVACSSTARGVCGPTADLKIDGLCLTGAGKAVGPIFVESRFHIGYPRNRREGALFGLLTIQCPRKVSLGLGY